MDTGSANGILGTREDERYALPVTRISTEGMTPYGGIITSTARRWTPDETLRISGSKTHSFMCERFVVFFLLAMKTRSVVKRGHTCIAVRQAEHVILPYEHFFFATNPIFSCTPDSFDFQAGLAFLSALSNIPTCTVSSRVMICLVLEV